MTTNIHIECVFLLIHCNMMNWKINYEAIYALTVLEIYENDWYEIHGKRSHYYIEGSTNMDIVFKCFVIWYWIQLHLMFNSQTTMLLLPHCTWTIPYNRYAILSILISFKTTRTWAYVASSLEALVGISKYLYFRNRQTNWFKMKGILINRMMLSCVTWPLTLLVTLTLVFQGQIMKIRSQESLQMLLLCMEKSFVILHML